IGADPAPGRGRAWKIATRPFLLNVAKLVEQRRVQPLCLLNRGGTNLDTDVWESGTLGTTATAARHQRALGAGIDGIPLGG
ncbi:MAG: hypothetical protein QOF73_2620, partial [Thermomicrobiales bacterium]|nr:hypothetical protein [Thermomicrobiales bacterium]